MERVQKYKVVPVVVINNIEDTIPTLKALVDGDLPIAEITFRTACAKEAIALGIKEFPDMLIGAGTVINVQQCKEAIDLGVKFIVGPGYNAEVSALCKQRGVPYFPGCVTPTEMMEAIADGWTTLKFFPANVYGGLKAMKSLAGPFPQVKFIPTGGVDAANLAEYLAWDKIEAVGGSWMMKGDIVAKCQEIYGIVNG
ncbi:bifunctional 4-hydroxy-2-oxoglutarate aldolase/2-dehydro-3-deoxy-phosphogluconate aldolase [Bengtsoniella intestinalis]|uniref:bifunctional 4-hydroxy-2-oxoglutarate aldolase/2-dehydro-3-deoxy-phosphogluconate aldolase n=1 Tax=Bengtsoniella intestinalis TaxID=3073143 RepID=UPI00391FC643